MIDENKLQSVFEKFDAYEIMLSIMIVTLLAETCNKDRAKMHTIANRMYDLIASELEYDTTTLKFCKIRFAAVHHVIDGKWGGNNEVVGE